MAAKSGGSENMTRLGMAIIDEYTQILRDILSMHIPQAQLYHDVKAKNIRLRPEQETLVAKAKMAGYANFDITLLYSLIRNLSLKIPKPTRGWGDSSGPGPGDKTLGDDIERIRLLRNVIYGHIPSTFISDADFRTYWSEITDVCKRMEKAVGGNYVKHIIELETCIIDEHTEQKYQKMIESERQLKEGVRAMHEDIKDIKEWLKEPKIQEENPRTSIKVTPSCMLSHKDKQNIYEEIVFETMNMIIEEIDENTPKENMFGILDEILRLDDSSNMSDTVVHFIHKLKAKIKWYKSVNKITGTEVMLKFLQVTIKLTARYNLKSISPGSLIFNFEFHSEAVSARYRSDFDSGILKKLLSEVLLFPAFLSLLGLSMKEVNLEVEKDPEVIISEGRQQADVQTGEQDTQNIGRSVPSITSYRFSVAMDIAGAQHYVECGSCDNYSRFYCNSCHTRLCEQCKKEHLRSKDSKGHEIVLYQERKMELPVEMCKKHPRKTVDLFCKDRKIPLCSKCMLENHAGHGMEDLDHIYSQAYTYCMTEVLNIKKVVVPKCQLLLGDVKKKVVQCKEDTEKVRSRMIASAKALKDLVDEVLSELTDNLNSVENQSLDELHNQQKKMNDHITYLNNIVQEYEKEITSKKPTELISFQNSIQSLKKIPEQAELCLPQYKEGQIDKNEIAKQLGSITKVTIQPEKREEISEKSSLPSKSGAEKTQMKPSRQPTMQLSPSVTKVRQMKMPRVSSVRHMSRLQSGEVWVSDLNKNLVKVDEQGNEVQKISTCRSYYGYHTVTNDGELLFTDRNKHCINKVTSNKTVTTVITTGEWQPRSIFCSRTTGEVLVGMKKKGEAKVVRYSASFQEQQTIQYDGKGQPLYKNPHYVTENAVNGDIVTSDYHKHAVVVVNKSGQHRFSYTGNSSMLVIRPYGVVTDKMGHIIVCDDNNNNVHVIDRDGQFLSILLSRQNKGIKYPLSLCVDNNHDLWLGQCHTETVNVYRYLQK